jgi:hypothetical protein
MPHFDHQQQIINYLIYPVAYAAHRPTGQIAQLLLLLLL